MKKKIILITIIYISTFSIIQAQNLTLDWAKSFGGIEHDTGYSIAIDSNNNIYSTGFFNDAVDFDPGTDEFNLISNGNKDIFIQKLDPSGNLIWVKSIGGAFEDIGFSIIVDSNDDVYLTGSFNTTVDFDPGLGTYNLTANFGQDIFLLKLNSNGEFIWAQSYDESGSPYGRSLFIDTLNNIYLIGKGWNNSGVTTIYASKIDPLGTSIWTRELFSSDFFPNIGHSIYVDINNNVYMTGYYNGTIDFDSGSGTTNLTSNGGDDIFVLKLNTNGDFMWAKSFGGTKNRDIGESITGDPFGNVYITGRFQDTVDFNPGSGIDNFNSNGGEDIFLLKLDSNGNYLWNKTFGSTSSDWGQSVIVGAENNIYLTGFFGETVDFDSSSNIANLTSNGQSDIFILKLDASGNYIFAESMGGSQEDWAYSITNDNLNNLLLTGKFIGTTDLDPSTSSFNLTSNGNRDVFIVKLMDNTLSVNENLTIKNIIIYPNPTLDYVNINLFDYQPLIILKLRDVSGKLITEYTFRNKKI